MRLDEKYAPKDWPDVIGQDKAIELIKRIAEIGGRAFWITGASGTGKSTIARIMAGQIADLRFSTYETTGRELTPSVLSDLYDKWRQGRSLLGSGWALIVNEAHGMSKPVIEKFLDLLEKLNPYTVIIFTTTSDGNDLFEEKLDSSPFASRCLAIRLAQRNLCIPFAAKAKLVAQAENLDGQPIESYVNLVKKCGNNLRQVYREIESGRMLQTANKE